jgi:hypothetical protein
LYNLPIIYYFDRTVFIWPHVVTRRKVGLFFAKRQEKTTTSAYVLAWRRSKLRRVFFPNLHNEDNAMMTHHLFAQGGFSRPTAFLLLVGLLCFGVASNSLAQSKDRVTQNSANQPVSNSIAAGANLHEKYAVVDLKIKKEKTESTAPEPAPTAGPSLREAARFANKKLELLNRIAKLVEEKRKLQAMRETYQSQLSELQDKVNNSNQRTDSITP